MDSGLSITVKSNAPWSGTVDGNDNAPTSGVTVALGSFRYDTAAAATTYAECATDTQLPASPSPFESGGVTGIAAYVHRHCVLVDWNDADGTIDSTITYSVTQ